MGRMIPPLFRSNKEKAHQGFPSAFFSCQYFKGVLRLLFLLFRICFGSQGDSFDRTNFTATIRFGCYGKSSDKERGFREDGEFALDKFYAIILPLCAYDKNP